MHLHDGVCGIYLDDAGLESANGTRYLRILKQHWRRQLVKSRLADKQLFVGKVVGLYHIYLLLYLAGNLYYLILVAPSGNGVLVYAGNAGCRHVKALDIYLATGEHSGNLIEDTSYVL